MNLLSISRDFSGVKLGRRGIVSPFISTQAQVRPRGQCSKNLWMSWQQVAQLHPECACENNQFTVSHAADAGFDLGDRIFADVPANRSTSSGQHRLRESLRAPDRLEMRTNDVLGLWHLPFLEVDRSRIAELKDSDTGRFHAFAIS